ncbi:MAG: acylphosphatase [Sphingobacteriales bacterium]|nr:acylphosphatase [Sphingobacteriales bacterium]
MRHVNITISGIVQGVGFRFWARNMAENLGIKGFVKNLPDQRVYIEAEGDEHSIDLFIEKCKAGPTHARVSKIEVVDSELVNFTNFIITR